MDLTLEAITTQSGFVKKKLFGDDKGPLNQWWE